MTTPEQIIIVKPGASDRRVVVVKSPDLDGSYGSNGDAIFFFTTDDIYVEWSDTYLLSDQPLRMAQEPLLIRKVED